MIGGPESGGTDPAAAFFNPAALAAGPAARGGRLALRDVAAQQAVQRARDGGARVAGQRGEEQRRLGAVPPTRLQAPVAVDAVHGGRGAGERRDGGGRRVR